MATLNLQVRLALSMPVSAKFRYRRNLHFVAVDFGLAKKTHFTKTLCGSPDYMAPEMIMKMGYGRVCAALALYLHYRSDSGGGLVGVGGSLV